MQREHLLLQSILLFQLYTDGARQNSGHSAFIMSEAKLKDSIALPLKCFTHFCGGSAECFRFGSKVTRNPKAELQG